MAGRKPQTLTGDSMHCSSAAVTHLATGSVTHFPCHKWIDKSCAFQHLLLPGEPPAKPLALPPPPAPAPEPAGTAAPLDATAPIQGVPEGAPQGKGLPFTAPGVHTIGISPMLMATAQ